MYRLRIAGLFLITALSLHAEDFTLKYFGNGLITLHTTLAFDGKGERLIAVAKNESGGPIQHAKICIFAASVKQRCLFELWNTVVWAPEAELTWNVATALKAADLSHDAVIEEYEGPKAAESLSSPAASPGVPIPPAPPPAPEQGLLTNESLINLAKAGVSDEVILGMVKQQPGKFTSSPEAIIALKAGGVPDDVISAVLNKTTEARASYADRSAPSGPAAPEAKIESNSKIYIAPMTSNLNEFIGAEIVKQHLPVRVVLDERDADYILSGLSQRTEVKWYDVISGSIVGGKDRLEASAKLVRVRDKAFVWAGESGDRSLIFDAFKRGGERKLAERIVNQMKHDLF